MTKIKSASVAGKFYSSDKNELLAQLNSFEVNNSNDYKCSTRVTIVPHAGYYYSGQLANNGIQYLNKKAKTVFIIAPTHYVPFDGLALSNYDKWSTTLGEVEVNQEANRDLIKNFAYCNYHNEAFADEHSAEVQVPFVQKYLPNAKIVPILVGKIDYARVTELIEQLWDDSGNVFIISSDLSHFYTSDKAKKIDDTTANMIESNDVEKFSYEQACGAVGVCALVNFAKEKEYSLIRVGLYNSGEATGDTSRVVGYGSWILYEGEKIKFLKDNFSKLLLDICKKSILAGLEEKEPDIDRDSLPAVFNEDGACFVTLEREGELRGCIGSIVAHRPLIDDLIKNAYSSAFSDPRFSPLKKWEFEDLSIAISLLSAPVKMTFKDEEDLLSQIKPNEDGIIIKDGIYHAVYLPSVWEQLPEKKIFLNSLKEKAGLLAYHFSKTFEAYRYTAEYVK